MDVQLAFDLFFCVIVLLFVVYPRFNSWPNSDYWRFTGKPRDYINDRLYLFYSLIYVLTFAAFTFALSRTPGVLELLKGVLGENILNFLKSMEGVLGTTTNLSYLILLLALLSLPQLEAIDHRWRAALLMLARVPKEALGLKQQLLEHLKDLELGKSRVESIIDDISQRGAYQWKALLTESAGCDSDKHLCELILKALYLVSLNKTIEHSLLDAQDLERVESRLYELAALAPALDKNRNPVTHNEHNNEIEKLIDVLAEMLAKNSVKRYLDKEDRRAVLEQCGFKLPYTDHKETSLVKPTIFALFYLAACCFFVIMVSLLIFDELNISPPKGGNSWFKQGRLIDWGVGSFVSYALATAFGLFFNEVMKDRSGRRSPVAFIPAFIFASLGSGIFFMLSKALLKPPFIWLAVSFGLFSFVVIQSRDRDCVDQGDVIAQATRLALIFGIASGVLQVAVVLSFKGVDEAAFNEIMAFFVFGLVRGGLVAFLVSFTFLEFDSKRVSNARRQYARSPYRRKVGGLLKGGKVVMLVKDISETGALVRIVGASTPREGDDVTLHIHNADVRGTVVWAKEKFMGVEFSPGGSNVKQLKQVLGTSLRPAM